MPGESSIFTGEATAIMEGLQWTNKSKKNTWIIATDSRSVLTAINSPLPKNSLIKEILNLWWEMKNRGMDVVFIWVPSHKGILGNEEADQAALLAREGETNEIVKKRWTTKEDWIHQCKKKILESWEKTWKTNTSKLSEIKKDCRKWETSNRQSRREEIVLSRIRIGHCLFTHGYLFRGLEAPTCQNCDNTPQTVRHVILECPQFRKIREKLKLTGTLREMLQNDEEKVAAVLKFLKETKYYKRI